MTIHEKIQATGRRPSVVKPLTLHENEVRFYQNEGYLVLPGMVKREDARTMREEALDILARLGVPREQLARAADSKDKLRQTPQYLAGTLIDSLVNAEELRLIASQLMGGPSTLYMPFTAVKAGGGGGKFHFHQDNQYTKFDGPGINIWFALDEMTPENGCLQVVPRSHLRGTLESVESSDRDGHRMNKVEPMDFLPVRMQPGDAIAFTRLTLHGSGPNSTSEARVAYAVQFHRDDVWATWEGQKKLLKGANRWNTAAVKEIAPPEKKVNYDGH